MSVVSSPSEAQKTINPTNNPLLIGRGLPPFELIKSEHVVPGIKLLLTQLAESLQALEAGLAAPSTAATWEGVVVPLTAISEQLGWSWGIIGHLMGVQNSPALRTAYESVQPDLVQFSNQMSQSQVIYAALKQLRASESWRVLADAQQRIVEAALRDAELSGVGLSGEPKAKFNEIQQALAELSTQFSNHVLDATKAFSLTLKQPEEVLGLPPSLLSLTAQAARDAGEEGATAEAGPWRITLDMPSYVPFMRHSQHRDLREKLYRAFITRASSGELDNAPLIEKILELRSQQANILGFENYAELSLARKMAPSINAVESLMEELRSASYDGAKREFDEIKAFAKTQAESTGSTDGAGATNNDEASDIKQWDVSFWTERMRERQFDLNDEALRPYFPLPKVLEGLFSLAERLFGIVIAAADGDAPVWHSDVRYFRVTDAKNEQTIAHFYLDPYSRPAEKRGGAWMDECIVRAREATDQKTADQKTADQKSTLRLPVAYLVCNQSPPIDGKPSLMTFREVETLFHEFGHGLQHMLTQVDYAGAAGINNVEWDAVELPSQFMENWCYERDTFFGMAKHYKTGEPLPETDYQKLLAARHFMTGSAILRQVNFGWLDIALHSQYEPGGEDSVWAIRDRIAQKTTLLEPLPEDAFLCSFGHIFAGGYAAGYYSYFWAEVLSADAFSAFEEAGLENKDKVATIGRKFRETVLALGGSRHPMEVFKAFRGREPSTQALLRHRGLAA